MKMKYLIPEKNVREIVLTLKVKLNVVLLDLEKVVIVKMDSFETLRANVLNQKNVAVLNQMEVV